MKMSNFEKKRLSLLSLPNQYRENNIDERKKSISQFAPLAIIVQKGCFETVLGSLRSYDGNCKENVSLKLNFALS